MRGLLSRAAAKPADWKALWAFLAPAGGRVTPDALDRISAAATALPRKTLLAADDQLGRAMGLLDTEDHARYLKRDAWQGPERRFARRRFVRALHAVLVAGPEAVARAAADPSVVGSYDPQDTIPWRERELDDTVALRLYRAINEPGGAHGHVKAVSVTRSANLTDRAEKGWPSIALGTPQWPHLFDYHDPEGTWLSVEAAVGALHDQSWLDAARDANERIAVALGERNPPMITSQLLQEALVTLRTPDDGEDEEPTFDEGFLDVTVTLDPAVLSALPVVGRADHLTRAASTALLEHASTLTPEAAAVLTRLATVGT